MQGNNVVPAYTYDSRLRASTAWASVGNNANAYPQAITRNWYANGNLRFVQDYTYDKVNRLAGVSEKMSNTNAATGTRTFSYDSWGNLAATGNSGFSWNNQTPSSLTQINTANNRLASRNYDASGNQLDVPNVCVNCLQYDAENRQVASVNSGTTSYQYDGLGERVEKVGASGTTVFVYDAFGQLTAECSTVSGGTPPCTTCYLVADHLGSTRLVTDQNANVVARHDYLPFGEEIVSGDAGRSGQYGASDLVNQKFTGQYRDQESGLDYFSARYFGSATGRFFSPDAPLVGADPKNPQSWNAYSYVRNSPLIATDPTGHILREPDPFFDGIGYGSGYGGGDPMDQFTGAASSWGNYNINPSIIANDNSGFDQHFGSNGVSGDNQYDPIQLQFTGTLFGKSYTQNFDTWDDYANWRTELAVQPPSLAYQAYITDCEYSSVPCTSNTVTERKQGLLGNYRTTGTQLDRNAVVNLIQDPINDSQNHPGDSWYSPNPFNSMHIAVLADGEVEMHFDTVNPIYFAPIHLLVDYLPSLFINKSPGQDIATYTCSVVGGCH